LILFVNNFFNFLNFFSKVRFGLLAATVIYYNSLFCDCQALFELFSKLSCFSNAATIIDFIRTVRFCQALFSSFLEVFVVSRGDK